MGNQRHHPKGHESCRHMEHDEDVHEDNDADHVRDEPATVQHEASGNAEGLADQERHAVIDEVAEEQADHHKNRPEHDVEQETPALNAAAVEPFPPKVMCASIQSGTATMASHTRMIQPHTPAIQST